MRPVTFVLGLVLASVSFGCADRDRALWHGDKRFTESERAAIREGEAWIAMSAGHEPGGVAFDYEVTSDQPLAWTIRREPGPSGATGECFGSAVYLGLDGAPKIKGPPVAPEFQPGLTAHEMAHCRYGFADGYHAEDVQTEGIMRNLAPMAWTDREEEQCERTKCRAEDR